MSIVEYEVWGMEYGSMGGWSMEGAGWSMQDGAWSMDGYLMGGTADRHTVFV